MKMKLAWTLIGGLLVSSASTAEPKIVKLGKNIIESPDFIFKTDKFGLFSTASVEKPHDVRVAIGEAVFTSTSVITIVEQKESKVIRVAVWPLPEKVKYPAAISQLEELLQSLGLPDDKIKDDINMRRAFKYATRYTTFELADGATLVVSMRSIDLSDPDIKKKDSRWWVEMDFFAPKE